jgi:hypothetical protein
VQNRQVGVQAPMRTLFVLLVAAAALTACSPRKIPGTTIDDTSETRAVLQLFSEYRKAVEARDAKAVLGLCDESFSDDGGSANPDDDLTYASLSAELASRFSRVQDVRLEMSIRKIELDDETNVARVTYSYTLNFRMPGYSGRTQSETDLKQMTLLRVGKDRWKIVSGI